MAEIEFPSRLKKLTDDNTGASYYSVSNDELFYSLPFKVSRQVALGSSGDIFLLKSRKEPRRYTAAKAFTFQNKRSWRAVRQEYLEEVSIFQKLKHENIVTCLGAVASPSYGIIIMDYFKEGALYESLDNLHDLHVHRYFVQILCAIRHMHSKRIVHRDIKVDNILLKDNNAFLTDFGLSRELSKDNSLVNDRVGTFGFIAPEADAASETTEYDGFKADSYSTGVFLWSMMLREEPDENTKLLDTIESTKNLDQTLLECVRRLLQPDPKDRWDITLLLEDLRSNGYRPWQIGML